MLSEHAWTDVLCGPADWPKSSHLLRQGEVPKVVYFVEEGVIKLACVTQDGNEPIIDIKHAPCFVGDSFVLAGLPSLVDAVTITNCVVRWCSAPAFIAALTSDTSRLVDAYRMQCAECIQLLDRIACLTLKSSRHRLNRFLETTTYTGRGPESLAKLRQSDVAAILNVTPEHLSRLRTQMAKAESGEKRRGFRRRTAPR